MSNNNSDLVFSVNNPQTNIFNLSNYLKYEIGKSSKKSLGKL